MLRIHSGFKFYVKKYLKNISDIPDFLRDSEFYRNLDLNNEEVITIPKLKMDDEVNNIKDFKKLFKTLNFFNVSRFPKSFIKIIVKKFLIL